MTTTFGAYGGRYVPETLIPALDELTAGWEAAKADDGFRRELHELLTNYAGRPTPLTRAERFAPDQRLYLKREDLLHTGAHKLNNALGQAVLARRLGKRRIVAETGAGQHGVATATVCARFGLECVVYMGAEDMRRQAPNVERMHLLGAEVRPVEFGTKTLKEATSEAIRDWITNVETTHYLIGSCVGPAPYPEIVRDLQRVIGDEAREQVLAAEGRLPDAVVACVGGGSNAIGTFYAFIDDPDVRLIGVEAAGAASLGDGPHGGPARRPVVGARRRGRPDRRRALDLGGARLPRRRPGARRAARLGPRRVPAVHRRGGARRAPPAHPDGGDHPGARDVACAGAGARPRRRADRRLPFGPRRQGSRRSDRASVTKLVVYLVCEPETPELAEAAVEGGADIVELGIPFSDPLAEARRSGSPPSARSRAACGRSNASSASPEVRKRVDVPLVPMTYAAILEAYGYERFVTDSRAAGATSAIVVDLPVEEHPDVPRIQLVAPTSTDERIALCAQNTDGWLYLVSLTGTTGARDDVSPALAGLVERARAATTLPLYAGFGISTPAHAAAVARAGRRRRRRLARRAGRRGGPGGAPRLRPQPARRDRLDLMDAPVKVACVQAEPVVLDREATIDKLERARRRGGRQAARSCSSSPRRSSRPTRPRSGRVHSPAGPSRARRRRSRCSPARPSPSRARPATDRRGRAHERCLDRHRRHRGRSRAAVDALQHAALPRP